MTAKQRATRAGFTLVEVLMVIAIIAILAALLITGLGRVRQTARKVQATNDITQLETVATKFKQDFGFYPPSHVTVTPDPVNQPNVTVVMRFMVPNKPSGMGTQQNEASLRVLQRMFPRWDPATSVVPATGNLNIPLAGRMLDPNQALIYFLGGPAALDPSVGEPGFNVGGPGAPSGSTKKGPYFDFPSGRLVVPDVALTSYKSGNAEPASPTPLLPNFVDPWGMPYAYFSANGDSYDGRLFFPFGSNFIPLPGDLVVPSTQYSGATGMRPIRMGNKWMNPGKMQIVSAGPNRQFGPGTQSASPTSPVYTAANDIKPGQTNGYSETDNGEDDIANFNEGSPLGTANN